MWYVNSLFGFGRILYEEKIDTPILEIYLKPDHFLAYWLAEHAPDLPCHASCRIHYLHHNQESHLSPNDRLHPFSFDPFDHQHFFRAVDIVGFST
jgi:hypothetical protein